MKIELTPDLDQCIETVAGKKYRELLKLLLENEAVNTEMEGQFEAIRLFLETADFRELRAESEKHLAKGKKVLFEVYLEGNQARWEMYVV